MRADAHDRDCDDCGGSAPGGRRRLRARGHGRRAIAAKVVLGGQPCGIAAAAGSVWVSDAKGAKLVRIDPRINEVTGRFPLDGAPCEILSAYKSLWIVTQSGRLDRVDPATGKLRPGSASAASRTRRPRAAARSGSRTARAGRCSGSTRRRTGSSRTIPFLPGGKPAGIVWAAGAVWVGDGYGSAVVRIDPRTFKLTTVRSGGAGAAWLAVANGFLWASNRYDGWVTQIDPVKRRRVATVKVGDGPVNLAAVGGEIWVPCDEDDTLWRIRANRTTEKLATGPNPAVVAGVDGEVWVSIFEGGEVWRITPG